MSRVYGLPNAARVIPIHSPLLFIPFIRRKLQLAHCHKIKFAFKNKMGGSPEDNEVPSTKPNISMSDFLFCPHNV